MSLNRKARRQFEKVSRARRTQAIGIATAGSVLATQAAFISPASAVGSAVVTNCNDTGAGSLRAAIDAANTNADLTTVTFELDPSCGNIAVASALPGITESINIQGPGASQLTISASSTEVISVSDDAQSFSISGLTLDGVVISHTADTVNGGVKTANVDGLVMKNVNDAGVVVYIAGAPGSTAIIQNSTFTDNRGVGDLDVSNLVYADTTLLTFKNNTVINNSFAESMIFTWQSPASVVKSNTIVANTTDTNGNSEPTFEGVGLFGNIIADLDASNGDVCSNVTDLGANLYSIVDNTNGCSGSSLPVGVQADGSSAIIASQSDLGLGSLDLNGGPTPNIPISENSVAKDYYTAESSGTDSTPLDSDQRGASRPAGAGYDVGSYELNGTFPETEDNPGATCTEKKLGTIRFAPYSAKLSKKSKKLIRAYVSKIKDSGCTTIELSAHTATTTGAAKSLKAKRVKLSKARNAAVQKYLTKQLKAAGVTVKFKKHALGAKNPVKSNKTGDGRAKNRRVVVVMKALKGTL